VHAHALLPPHCPHAPRTAARGARTRTLPRTTRYTRTAHYAAAHAHTRTHTPHLLRARRTAVAAAPPRRRVTSRYYRLPHRCIRARYTYTLRFFCLQTHAHLLRLTTARIALPFAWTWTRYAHAHAHTHARYTRAARRSLTTPHTALPFARTFAHCLPPHTFVAIPYCYGCRLNGHWFITDMVLLRTAFPRATWRAYALTRRARARAAHATTPHAHPVDCYTHHTRTRAHTRATHPHYLDYLRELNAGEG